MELAKKFWSCSEENFCSSGDTPGWAFWNLVILTCSLLMDRLLNWVNSIDQLLPSWGSGYSIPMCTLHLSALWRWAPWRTRSSFTRLTGQLGWLWVWQKNEWRERDTSTVSVSMGKRGQSFTSTCNGHASLKLQMNFLKGDSREAVLPE